MSTSDDTSLALRAAHDVLASRRALKLEPRDVALIVLMHGDLVSSTSQAFVAGTDDLRALSSKIDVLEGLGTAGAELRLTTSVTRLLNADCLTRADVVRIKHVDQAQYQLTSLGEALATWQMHQLRFDGQPLGTVLRAFNVQLVGVLDRANLCDSENDWQVGVSAPMRYVAGELLAAVTRHQRALDRAHEDIRNFVPSLLKTSSEEAIDRCREVLETVIGTIRDLVSVTIDISNSAFFALDRLQDLGEQKGFKQVATPVCEDLRRRLEVIVAWTTQRNLDWGSHYDTVHSYLRFVASVDRSRRIVDALKRSIAEVPDWSLLVASAPRMMYLGERPTPVARRVITRKRQDHSKEVEEVTADELPLRLRELAALDLEAGRARWSDVTAQGASEAGLPRVIPYLPQVMQFLVLNGEIDDHRRADVTIDGGLTMEELEVRRP